MLLLRLIKSINVNKPKFHFLLSNLENLFNGGPKIWISVLKMVLYTFHLKYSSSKNKLYPYDSENFIFTINSDKLQLFSTKIHQNWKHINRNTHLQTLTGLWDTLIFRLHQDYLNSKIFVPLTRGTTKSTPRGLPYIFEWYRLAYVESKLKNHLHFIQLMLDCWKDSPHCRPSFAKLEKEFGSLLEKSDRCRYVEQCRQFESNIAKLRGSLVRPSEVENRDYLAMMSPPSYRFAFRNPLEYQSGL